MNSYAVIILAALAADFILQLIADILNLRALRDELPAEFEGVYDAEKYKKSQSYLRVNTRFGFITDVFDIAVLLIFWFFGGFNYIDTVVRSWVAHPILLGLVYIGILLLLKILLSLPFSIYRTFIIEERFGFNRTTPATFIKDIFKGIGLTIVFGGPILAGVLALFEYTGAYAWVYCWIAVALYELFVQFIAPTWIMPLFNKFTPLDPGELRDSIISYAESVKFPLKGVFVMDGSRRSAKSNAFFTGFGKNKRIALFDTLIPKHTTGELVAVLAHEIGHYKKKHIIKGLAISIVHTGVLFFLLSIFLTHTGLYDAFYIKTPSVYTGLIFFGLLFTPIELFLSIGLNIYSRKNEYEADRYSAETYKKPEELAAALKQLSVHNLSNLTPHPFYVFLNYSHPPVLKRIEALKKI